MKANRIMCILTCLFAGACSGQYQIQSDLNKLSERLVSFTNITTAEVDGSYRLVAPTKQSLATPIADLQIALREFYAIDDCPLGQFIAQRNTSMGKTQLPSVRFVYEKELLSTLLKCSEQLPVEHKMQEQLQNWIMQKQSNLPAVWSNMMMLSDEMYLAFTMSQGFITGDSQDSLAGTRLALAQLNQSLAMADIDSTQLELHLRELSESRLPAKMWRTQKLLIEQLVPISNLLAQYIEQTRIEQKRINNDASCSRALKDELKIMRNIFSMLFADNIQPLASQLNHYQYQLDPHFEFIANHPNIPLSWQQYVQAQYIDNANEYRHVMQSHIELWQTIFKLCE